MSWLKVVMTRVVVGEVVHGVLKIVQPGLHVNHFLIVLIVFFVTLAFGVVPEADQPSDGAAGER